MITENYIKMCEKAEEIQKEWKKKRYDIITYNKKISRCNDTSYWEIRKDLIYLPTQEQLQEMIKENYLAEFGMVFKLWNWIDKGIHHGTMNFNIKEITLTELWLAFVMHEKWNKFWTGEKWVKGNE